MQVLGIETSCDETGVAVVADGALRCNIVHSQIALHAQYGGVVPELASRDHVRKITPLIRQALDECQLNKSDIDGIAYTAGPGLMGALLAGVSTARSLAYAWDVPAIPVHHLEGHLLAPLLEDNAPDFPFVALLVSGGHTQLFDVAEFGQYQLLGESLDDAAGEAFDKTAKLLGLPYPGGKELADLALLGDPERFQFPRPMTNRPGLDFSFSGLKTSARTTIANHSTANGSLDQQTKADVAHAFQAAVVDTLVIKCKRALQQTGRRSLVVAGGVGANKHLREQLRAAADADGWQLAFPALDLCTDNGGMIAYAGYHRLKHGDIQANLGFSAKARWPLSSLSAGGDHSS